MPPSFGSDNMDLIDTVKGLLSQDFTIKAYDCIANKNALDAYKGNNHTSLFVVSSYVLTQSTTKHEPTLPYLCVALLLLSRSLLFLYSEPIYVK
jgi:hypothetical protein